MASLPAAAQISALAIAAMLGGAGTNANIDAFAEVLAQAPAPPLFKAGLGLASDPAALTAIATKRVTAGGLDEVRDLINTERPGSRPPASTWQLGLPDAERRAKASSTAAMPTLMP